ncbi:MAG: hypothetical protein EPN97_07600, partial [Alphaproteobacteria bacterium]
MSMKTLTKTATALALILAFTSFTGNSPSGWAAQGEADRTQSRATVSDTYKALNLFGDVFARTCSNTS